ALVRYLRRRQFAGNIRVELSGYEADISLTATNEMRVREHDRIAGRVSEGEEALQRLLIRAREPGGIINVYQAVKERSVEKVEKKETAAEIKTPAPVIENTAQTVEEKPVIVKAETVSVAAQLPAQNGNHQNGKNKLPAAVEDLPPVK
ncbi:hypothetical protein, partial [Clavibacter michiganensis]|uniref:hypothetical protein n=1 Tax=Clavibacter michiganensis TaxID=28447 RepID=UPI00292FA488